MGVVVLATNVHLGHRVAIKFLSPRWEGDRVVAARFLREAQAAARILDPHVVRILDVDKTESGHPFLVMDPDLEGRKLLPHLTKKDFGLPHARGILPSSPLSRKEGRHRSPASDHG